jgi:hypothetical protein
MFIHDRDGRVEAVPDLELLHRLLDQIPIITRNADGSRTIVFDLCNPAEAMAGPVRRQGPSLESLRAISAALSQAARELGLPLTAALAESAELLAAAETQARDTGLAPGD